MLLFVEEQIFGEETSAAAVTIPASRRLTLQGRSSHAFPQVHATAGDPLAKVLHALPFPMDLVSCEGSIFQHYARTKGSAKTGGVTPSETSVDVGPLYNCSWTLMYLLVQLLLFCMLLDL